MNTDHAAEHARLTEKANFYTLKAKQHANDRQGLFFATMARAKELQAQWHWRRMSIELTHPWVGLSAKIVDAISEGRPLFGFSGRSHAGTQGGNFTSDTNIAQVPQRRYGNTDPEALYYHGTPCDCGESWCPTPAVRK